MIYDITIDWLYIVTTLFGIYILCYVIYLALFEVDIIEIIDYCVLTIDTN